MKWIIFFIIISIISNKLKLFSNYGSFKVWSLWFLKNNRIKENKISADYKLGWFTTTIKHLENLYYLNFDISIQILNIFYCFFNLWQSSYGGMVRGPHIEWILNFETVCFSKIHNYLKNLQLN